MGFNVRGRDVQSVVKDLQERVAARIRLPPGYYVTYGGQFENLVAAKKRLSIAVPVSLLLILVLLYFAFHSLSESLLIFSAIPLSAIGGVLALSVRGMPFSISAGVGFIALFGIAVLNGIVLLSEFNHLQKAGITNVWERIRQGTSTRLRPVLMTASVASLGFLPMAMSNGAGAEVQRPLATVVIGGLITATLLTLVVLPCLYLLLHSIQKSGSHIKGRPKSMVMVVVFTSLTLSPARSQERTISLEAAIDTAVTQNLSIRASRLNTGSLRSLEKSAFDIPLAGVQAEYGKINSIASDTRFTFTQSAAFPVVYKRQLIVYQAQTRSSVLNEAVIRNRIKKEVVQLYYEMLLMLQKKVLLLRADSLYSAVARRQQERFRAGENNMVEKTSAETQSMQVKDQLQQLQADFSILQTGFGYLLNSSTLFIPAPAALKLTLARLPDTTEISQYPAVQLKKQQQLIAQQEIRLYKARKLPYVTLGYNNQSIIGY